MMISRMGFCSHSTTKKTRSIPGKGTRPRFWQAKMPRKRPRKMSRLQRKPLAKRKPAPAGGPLSKMFEKRSKRSGVGPLVLTGPLSPQTSRRKNKKKSLPSNFLCSRLRSKRRTMGGTIPTRPPRRRTAKQALSRSTAPPTKGDCSASSSSASRARTKFSPPKACATASTSTRPGSPSTRNCTSTRASARKSGQTGSAGSSTSTTSTARTTTTTTHHSGSTTKSWRRCRTILPSKSSCSTKTTNNCPS
mmetsp:Transcript_6919/g.15849  ORF Transcript_6919/g.15849 Transcript_6919/m.15849 type:complete len:248 (-) Transcript_6919:1289-2032(-)